MSQADVPSPFVNSLNGQHFSNKESINYPTHNSTGQHIFNGFHTFVQPNSPNQPDNRTLSEHSQFTGFHTHSSEAHARNDRDKDNLGGVQQGQTNSSINNDTLQDQYGISQSKPKYAQYAVKTVRVSSYRNFPSGITQTPEELAEAGFFYSGQEDVVFCYFCGQGLRSWEPEDNVWIEHARWAPQCIHLLNCKGKDFVKMVELAQVDPEQQMPTFQNGTNGLQNCSNNGTDNLDTTSVSKSEPVDDHSSRNHGDLEVLSKFPNADFMTTVAAESVIRNGYDKTSVQKAINIFIQKEGRTDFSATDILTIILELEDGTIKYDEIFPEPKPGQALEVKSGPAIVVNKPLSKTNKSVSSEKRKVDEAEAKTLLEENRQLKEQTVCKICLEDDVSIVFLPCGHLCCCSQCAPAVRKCPICREHIKGTVKTYLP